MPRRKQIDLHTLTEKLFALLYREPPASEEQLIRRLTGGKSTSKALYRTYSLYRHEGWLTRDPEGRIGIETREGILRINPRGFGFVTNPDYPGEDVFVPERWLLGARHEDRVLVWIRREQGAPGPEGRIMDILSRSTERVVGRLDHHRVGWRVIPRDTRRPIVQVSRIPKGAKSGDLVTAKIMEWPLDPGRAVRGDVESVLGNPKDPGIDVTVLAVERQLPTRFPDSVQQEADRLPDMVTEDDLIGRLDLREELVVTIDGSDAKDLDDAISVKETSAGFEVGVHIADVSSYVREDSALDREARERGTSIYLVDRVIPMLPERLSNGIASLNPGVTRLTVSAFIELDRSGNPVSARFSRSAIRSRYRLTYEGVNAMLADPGSDETGLAEWLQIARKVRDLLRRRRVQRGAVDFDLPEAKVVLDPEGMPVDVVIRTRGVAESLIEEFMLLANEAVAHKLLKERLPGLFRVHDQPGSDKMDQFRELIGALGYRLPQEITPKSLQELLERVKGRPEERVVNSALLRSMKQARYGPVNIGHFGLASDEYTHFTSPIRRYPDLWVHRVLTGFLENQITDAQLHRWRAIVSDIGEIASVREREAMDVERDSVQLKQTQYMAQRIGEVYGAVISGVTNFGIFVELPNLIEGLVRIEDLPKDYWVFDPVHLRLTGQRTGREYQLGHEVTVQVVRVDLSLRRIDFRLMETVSDSRPGRPQKERPSGKKGGQRRRRRR